VRQLRAMLHLGAPAADGWEPAVLTAVAMRNEGSAEIIAAIEQHTAHLQTSNQGTAHAPAHAERELTTAVQELTRERLRGPAWDAMAQQIMERTQDPYSAAAILLDESS